MNILNLITKSKGLRIALAILVIAIIYTRRSWTEAPAVTGIAELKSVSNPEILSVGFVVADGVFNSELMAPYDVFHHSIFRDEARYAEPFIVSENGEPVTSFEGITISSHFSFETAPRVDILVIPSGAGSMSVDLKNERFVSWLSDRIEEATYVISLCDGAFLLAETGVLNGKAATTFPGDREALQTAYPDVNVHFDVRFVHDEKFITSVGGGMSYEPALYLMESLYGKTHADETAEGLVWDWDLTRVPHLVVNQ